MYPSSQVPQEILTFSGRIIVIISTIYSPGENLGNNKKYILPQTILTCYNIERKGNWCRLTPAHHRTTMT